MTLPALISVLPLIPENLESLRSLGPVFLCSCRAGPLTPFQVAGAALRVLLALARLHPAADPERGTSLYPLPLAHRQMASQRCLPHIAQVNWQGVDSARWVVSLTASAA